MTKPSSLKEKDGLSFVFNTTLRFTLLRLILVSSLVSLSYGIWFTIYNIQFGILDLSMNSRIPEADIVWTRQKQLCAFYPSYPVIVLVHHFSSLFGPRISLPAIVDLVLVFAESAIVTLSLIWSYIYFGVYFNKLSDTFNLVFLTATWALVISLLSLAGLRTAMIVKIGPQGLLRRVDVLLSEDNAKRSMPTDVLFGRTIWRRQILNERRYLVWLRVVVIVVCTFAIVVFGFTNLIMEPVRQIGLTSVKEFRTTQPPHSLDLTNNFDFYAVVGGITYDPYHPEITFVNYTPAVTVTRTGGYLENITCARDPSLDFNYMGEVIMGQDLTWARSVFMRYVNFHCPMDDTILARSVFFQLDVTVNFTELVDMDWIASPVEVRVGFTRDRENSLAQTPILLTPGLNAVAQMSFMIRQKYKDPSLFTLGIFNEWNTYLATEISYVHNNPDNTAFPPNTSSVRVYLPWNFNELRVIQDYSQASVLSGFAAIGGLWTFLGAIFALLFGRNIMQSMFGTKPLSVFGLLHAPDKTQIREAYLSQYGRLTADLSTESPRDQGLLNLLCDHIVDVDILKSSQDGSDVEEGDAEQ